MPARTAVRAPVEAPVHVEDLALLELARARGRADGVHALLALQRLLAADDVQVQQALGEVTLDLFGTQLHGPSGAGRESGTRAAHSAVAARRR